MALDQRTRFLRFVVADCSHAHKLVVATIPKAAQFIENVGNASGHARREIAADLAKDHNNSASHIFAAVISDAFDDRRPSAVPNAESFARAACRV
jgi:hypothetical protein